MQPWHLAERDMAWFSRFTRFGQAHMCYAQEKSDSCGIASSIMVNFKLKAGSIGRGSFATALFPSLGGITGKLLGDDSKSATVLAEKQVYALVSSVYNGTTGTTGQQVAALLNALNIGTWRAVDPAPTNQIAAQVVACYKNGWPTIIGNSWFKGPSHVQKSVGGHWVVADTLNRMGGTLYASICDPITGNVHVTEFTVGQDFIYDPSNPIGWEAPLDDYKAYADGYKSKGYSKMDGMVYCTTSSMKMIGTGGLFAV
jgi:hypothetical protein